MQQNPGGGATAAEATLLGHPRGLFVLFFAELWERFCYYGMRALLAFYIAEQFFGNLSQGEGQSAASASYGGFTALVYALGIFGGSIADRLLGYRRAIVLGGLFMAAGEFLLMVPKFELGPFGQKEFFFFGLSLLIVGNGLFKPNISSLVGKLYQQGDPRRDGGFTIFYMGINIGAALAPVFCGMIAYAMGTPAVGEFGQPGYVPPVPDYRYGFLLAGIGMLLGLVCFGSFTKYLGDKGLPPPGKEGVGPILKVVAGGLLVAPICYALLKIDASYVGTIIYVAFGVIVAFLLAVAAKEETIGRQRMFVLVLLLLLNSVFWAGFEQAGNSLNFFAKGQLHPLALGSWTMPPEWWQSVNAVLIVALGPVFAALWVMLDRRGANPSIPAKFGIGFLGMGVGFVVLNLGIGGANSAGLVFWYFLFGLYLVHTIGELCISPVGLSMVTKLAPARMTGMVMGAWFISIAAGNFLAGEISSLAADRAGAVNDALAKVNAYGGVFGYVAWAGIGLGIAVIVVSKFINRWMHGVK
ncbi:MAG: peptide MFS transporter [Planctomycetes bacterium]|nr:peptide MFS transporter [Planctomycetota bacterium]